MDPQALGRHCWPGLWLIIQTVPLFVSLALNWYRNSLGKVNHVAKIGKPNGNEGVEVKVGAHQLLNASLASAQGQEW